MRLHWTPHPIAELFPGMTPEEKAELKKDMRQRAENGLEPLEHAILLYEEMLLDGRHRDEAWLELAEENACNGFFKRNMPPTETFLPEKHGNLGAFLRAKSRNMIHRHIPADQKVAILLHAGERYPEVKAALDAIKDENLKRRKGGRPLDAGDRRGNTAEQVGQLAGAGATTVKQVKRLKAKAPEQFKEVVQGKKTAKKALQELAKEDKKSKKAPKSKESVQAEACFKPGDKVYRVRANYGYFPPSVELIAYRVDTVHDKTYLTTSGERIAKVNALTLDAAKGQHAAFIRRVLPELTETLAKLKAALKRPQIEHRDQKKA
jgi:hypothetical protein